MIPRSRPSPTGLVAATNQFAGKKGVYPSMGSSTAVAFRALVMLACLVTVPAVAIFWDSWPQVRDSLLAGRLPKLVVVDESTPDPHAGSRGGEAPPYQPVAPNVSAAPSELSAAPPWNPPAPSVEAAAPPMSVAEHESPQASPPPWAVGPPPPAEVTATPSPHELAPPQDTPAVVPGQRVIEPHRPDELRPGERSPYAFGERRPGVPPQPRRPSHTSPADVTAPADPSVVATAGAEPMVPDQALDVAPAHHTVDPNSATPFRGPEHTVPDAVRPAADALASSNSIQMHPTLTAPPGSVAPAAMAQMHPSATDPNAGLFHLTPSTTPSVAPPAATPPAPGDLFSSIQVRLRELGATYYLLETWGQDGSLYRFHCKMTLAGNSRHNRHFEATEADPLLAMQRVLEQVEAWRAGH